MIKSVPILQIKQFGRFEVWLDGALIPPKAWGRRKTQTLFKILLSERGKVFSTDWLIDAMFPDLEPDKAMVNLRGRVGELRRALEPNLAKNTDSQFVLTADGGGYFFSDDSEILVDTEALFIHLKQAQREATGECWKISLEHYAQSVELYRGQYLEEDPYEEWTLSLRDQYQQRYLDALDGLTQIHELLAQYAEAVEACRQALIIDPLRESIHRRLMRCHYLLGAQSEALQAFESCKEIFRDQLDAEPSTETIELYEQIKSQTLPKEAASVNDKSAKSVAVLPFVNLSDGNERDYFSDGLTEDIIAQLSKLHELKVISRTSVMAYKGTQKAVRAIGRELGVAHVLEGSVRQFEDQVRVVTQLVNARTDEPLWSETYDRQLTDLFVVQTEISERIADALQAHISDSEHAQIQRTPTHNMDVYQLYLKGRFALNETTETGYREAIELFKTSVSLDSNFGLGYAALAECFDSLSFFNFLPAKEGYLSVKEMALKALELDQTLGEAHAGLANVRMFYEWDWDGAKQALDRAIKLSPGFAVAHAQLSRWYLYHHHFDAALDSMNRALTLDPLSHTFSRDQGYVLLFTQQYDEAVSHLRAALKQYEHDHYMRLLLGLAYLGQGHSDKALSVFNQAERVATMADPYLNMCLMANRGIVQMSQGDQSSAKKTLKKLKQNEQQRDRSSILATLLFAMGETERGFEWLEQAVDNRDPWLCHLQIWPFVDDNIRKDARYKALMDQIGFSSEA